MRKNLLKRAAAVLAAAALLVSASPATLNAAGISETSGRPTLTPNQRPIAVMVDNEKTALKHYGVGEADVVYELMNSTANGRITRLMCVYKDWAAIPRIGSIRSTRPTNMLLAAEWNAVLLHDGGPFYNNAYYGLVNHISGGFARIANGKPREFTEYVTAGQPAARMAAAGIPATGGQVNHFNFGAVTLAGQPGARSATTVGLPFPHNASRLVYNAATMTYDYYEYGSIHTDAEDGQVATFDNVLIQNCAFTLFDANGYMMYNCVGSGSGYYLTRGMAIPVTWTKSSNTDVTRFYNTSGSQITLNAGKTYITLVPSDSWAALAIG
ncbi:MAG: DUF3048 domain-containing protein [Lachnospiraceae bacterium]|nr:DUF3048 domain-containing protein [Lachnospiraceae bacterium]